MFELPSSGSVIMLIIVLALLYWTFKDERNEKKSHQYQRSQEKALLDNVTNLTTTRVKFERHLSSVLDKVASYKIQSVIITDEKEIPQSVLLPYAEYKILQECYDKEEAKELAPLIEKRMRNNANKDDFISHEEMIKIIDEKRAHKHTEEKS